MAILSLVLLQLPQTFVGLPLSGSIVVAFGAMATVVNTLKHRQVGMVFEMSRHSARFFRLMEETIESTLKLKRS